MLTKCLQCGTQFACRPSEKRKFCTGACYRAYETVHGRPSAVTPIEFKCETCGAAFRRNPGELRSYRKTHGKDPKYCSRRCGWDAKKLTDEQWQVHCVQCGRPMPIMRRPGGTVNRQRRLCGTECRRAFKLAEHERLRPVESREVQRHLTKQGYVRLRFPNAHGVKGREVLEHRYVMERLLGRPLRPEETVHHRNGQKAHNEPDNLELRSGNHGPGGDVSAMIRWAHEIIALYPQFDREGQLHPVDVPG